MLVESGTEEKTVDIMPFDHRDKHYSIETVILLPSDRIVSAKIDICRYNLINIEFMIFE